MTITNNKPQFNYFNGLIVEPLCGSKCPRIKTL